MNVLERKKANPGVSEFHSFTRCRRTYVLKKVNVKKSYIVKYYLILCSNLKGNNKSDCQNMDKYHISFGLIFFSFIILVLSRSLFTRRNRKGAGALSKHFSFQSARDR